jgi:hypothetical protein
LQEIVIYVSIGQFIFYQFINMTTIEENKMTPGRAVLPLKREV